MLAPLLMRIDCMTKKKRYVSYTPTRALFADLTMILAPTQKVVCLVECWLYLANLVNSFVELYHL